MEGSMFDESLTLCSQYVQVETRLNRCGTNYEGLQGKIGSTPFFNSIGRGLAGKCIVNLDHKTWLQAHRYVLFNYDNIGPYLK